MTLAHSVAFGYDYTFRTLYRTTHIGMQFGTFHGAVAMNGIHLAVIVEQHTEVIDVTLHVVMRPWSAYVLCRKALQPLAVDVGIYIKLSVGIAYARCPDALTVYFLMIFQREAVFSEWEAVEAIADVLPVYEVLGMQDNQSGHGVHSGSC